MTSIYSLLITYFIIILWILSFTFLYRKRISYMTGMMIAMSTGMTIGLTFGIVLGILYSDQLFKMTVISMIIGGMTGVIFGIQFNIIAVIDGFMSGIMGGMMGVMLGVMIPNDTINTVINVFAVFSSGILFLLFLLIQHDIIIKEKGWRKFFFAKQLPLFLVVILFFILSNQYQYPIPRADIDHSSHLYNSTHK
ncbi:hypothetical protein ACJ2A9_03345 [Anaerobacillus sp. MEB173]|uniref:hypothetical protein n=1 Tax=Anaerobacillus sp. MEB173 TaxID=3383345 RepID=UPI003F92E8B9